MTLFVGIFCSCVEVFFTVQLEGTSRGLLNVLNVSRPAGLGRTISGPSVHVVSTPPTAAVGVVCWLKLTLTLATDTASSFPFSCTLVDKLQALACATSLCFFCWSALELVASRPSSSSTLGLFLLLLGWDPGLSASGSVLAMELELDDI